VRNQAIDALVQLVGDIKTAKENGLSEAELATARDFQRKAQFYFDFVEADNSTGFHAPDEEQRILAESINLSRQGQLALRVLKASAK
jgi:nitrite reductase (cytochrome c-552)